jgi:hypothetical protein
MEEGDAEEEEEKYTEKDLESNQGVITKPQLLGESLDEPIDQEEGERDHDDDDDDQEIKEPEQKTSRQWTREEQQDFAEEELQLICVRQLSHDFDLVQVNGACRSFASFPSSAGGGKF